jgi:DNA-binding NarL/FixJ family response regulator
MQTVKPFDLNDCIQLIRRRAADIENGSCDVLIDESWVNGIDIPDLLLLARHCPSSQEMIAKNTKSPLLLKSLAGIRECINCVAQNANTPSDALVDVIETHRNNYDWFVSEWEIELSSMPEMKRLASRYTTPYYSIAPAAVANHANASPSLLQEMASHEDGHAKAAVARNPNTPISVLQLLARDPESSVRSSVVSNRNVPANVLQTLATDFEGYVREAVAKSTQTPATVLAELAKDADERVRHAVAENSQTSAEVLADLARDTSEWVRKAVVANRNTSPQVLKLLAHDASGSVSKGSSTTESKGESNGIGCVLAVVVVLAVGGLLVWAVKNEEAKHISSPQQSASAPSGSSVGTMRAVRPLQLNMRSRPGKQYSVVRVFKQNERIVTIGEPQNVDGELWIQAATPDGQTRGWVGLNSLYP